MTKKKLVWSTRPCQVHQKKAYVAFYTFNVLMYFYKLLIKRKPLGFYKVLTKQKNIQFNANQMNKSRARIELYKLYTGPAFVQMVWRKLYLINKYEVLKQEHTFNNIMCVNHQALIIVTFKCDLLFLEWIDNKYKYISNDIFIRILMLLMN